VKFPISRTGDLTCKTFCQPMKQDPQ